MGFSLPVIAKLLDDENLSTTEVYAETDIDMINDAFAKASAFRDGNDDDLPDKKWKNLDDEAIACLLGLR
jgi:hypothetical protein